MLKHFTFLFKELDQGLLSREAAFYRGIPSATTVAVLQKWQGR
jgi:hypothetical protein